MKKYLLKALALAAIAALAVLLPGCGQSGHTVIIAGSTSVQPYAEILEEAFARLHDGEIDVQGGGSSAGITAAESGTADIGMSSRALKEAEQGLWCVEIAKDGLAVIVHPLNPVADLSLEEIRAIYCEEITNWRQLGGRDAKIHIITREDGSGSRSAFEDLVMGGKEISHRAIVQASNGAVRLLVSDDRDAIGFISLGLVEEGEKPVKALRLGGVAATRENVVSGAYTLFRPFLFVAREKPTGLAMDFIEFTLSAEGRRILTAEGLVTEDAATTPAVIDPDFDYLALFRRLEGYWNTVFEDDGTRIYGFTSFIYRDGKPGLYCGVWDGEGSDFGELIGGRNTGENTAELVFWFAEITGDGLWSPRPERTEALSLDFGGLDEGKIEIRLPWNTVWTTHTYSAATFGEAGPEIHF